MMIFFLFPANMLVEMPSSAMFIHPDSEIGKKLMRFGVMPPRRGEKKRVPITKGTMLQ